MPSVKRIKSSSSVEDADDEPLFCWVKNCFALEGLQSPRTKLSANDSVSFAALCDGYFLNAVLVYIDPRPSTVDVALQVPDTATRLKNLATLLNNILSFYNDVLNQIVVMSPLPDLITIARNPNSPGLSANDLRRLVLLLLGCAVQSDKKKEFIGKIQDFDLALQEAVAEEIQKITTNDFCYVLNAEAFEAEATTSRTIALLLSCLRSLAIERSNSVHARAVLGNDPGSVTSPIEKAAPVTFGNNVKEQQQRGREAAGGESSNALMSPTLSGRHHLSLELAEVKAKLRRQRQEIEEKTELLAEYKAELSEKDLLLQKQRQENLDLLSEARNVKAYRDELDILREKASKVDRLESECSRLKGKLNELDYFKSRVEELREENGLLHHSERLLSEEVEALKTQAKANSQAELQLLQTQKTVQDLQQELTTERARVAALMSDNVEMENRCKDACGRAAATEAELESQRSHVTPRDRAVSLADELNNGIVMQLHRLELENKQLRSQLSSQASSDASSRLNSRQDVEHALKTDFDEASLKQGPAASVDSCHKNAEVESHTESPSSAEQSTLCKSNSFSSHVQLAALDREMQELRERFARSEGENERLEQENLVLAQERNQISAEISKLQAELEALRYRNLGLEKQTVQMEGELEAARRELRCAEKENAKLRTQLEDALLEAQHAAEQQKLVEQQNEELVTDRGALEQLATRLSDVEAEKLFVDQQLEVETRKNAALNKDYATEKAALNSTTGVLERVLNLIGVTVQPDNVSIEHGVQMHMQSLHAAVQQELDDIKARFHESEQKNLALQSTIAQLKDEIQSLRLRFASESKNSSATSENSQRDKLEELAILEENRSAKLQISILQDQLRQLQTASCAVSAENKTLKQRASALQYHQTASTLLQEDKARLEIDNHTLACQVELLETDNSELRAQVSRLEKDYGGLSVNFNHIQQMYDQLMADHERFDRLHHHLVSEYDELKCQLDAAKQSLKEGQLKHEDSMRLIASLQSERDLLKQKYDDLDGQCQRFRQAWEETNRQTDRLKLELNSANLKCVRLEGELIELQSDNNEQCSEIMQLSVQLETVQQLKNNLQSTTELLLSRQDRLHKELLQESRRDKEQQRANEEKLHEQLSSLTIQKTQLEAKIMEQYKNMESMPWSKAKKSTSFIKRAKALFPRSSSKHGRQRNGVNDNGERLEEDNTSSSSPSDDCFVNVNSKPARSATSGSNNSEKDAIQCYDEIKPSSLIWDKDRNTVSAIPLGKPRAASLVADHVSLSGSERGVDVPYDDVMRRKRSEPAFIQSSLHHGHSRVSSSIAMEAAKNSSAKSGLPASSRGPPPKYPGKPGSVCLSDASSAISNPPSILPPVIPSRNNLPGAKASKPPPPYAKRTGTGSVAANNEPSRASPQFAAAASRPNGLPFSDLKALSDLQANVDFQTSTPIIARAVKPFPLMESTVSLVMNDGSCDGNKKATIGQQSADTYAQDRPTRKSVVSPVYLSNNERTTDVLRKLYDNGDYENFENLGGGFKNLICPPNNNLRAEDLSPFRVNSISSSCDLEEDLKRCLAAKGNGMISPTCQDRSSILSDLHLFTDCMPENADYVCYDYGCV